MPSPGRQDAGEAGQSWADDPFVVGQAFEGVGGRRDQGVVTAVLGGANEIPTLLGDGEGDQDVRSWKLPVEVCVQPWLRVVMLTRGTRPMAARAVDGRPGSTGLAVGDGKSVVAWTAMDERIEHVARGQGTLGMLRKLFRAVRGEDVGEWGHGCRPRLHAVIRSEASSWPC